MRDCAWWWARCHAPNGDLCRSARHGRGDCPSGEAGLARAVARAVQAPPRGFASPGGGNVLGGGGQPEHRHVAVDCLVLAGLNEIGFVPDPYTAVLIAHHPAETLPRRKVRVVLVASEAL